MLVMATSPEMSQRPDDMIVFEGNHPSNSILAERLTKSLGVAGPASEHKALRELLMTRIGTKTLPW